MRYFEEKKKAIMGEIDYGLPKNYRAVEYLESTSENNGSIQILKQLLTLLLKENGMSTAVVLLMIM